MNEKADLPGLFLIPPTTNDQQKAVPKGPWEDEQLEDTSARHIGRPW